MVDLISNSNDNSTKYSVAQSLGKIDPGNENAINALVDLIRNSNNYFTNKYAVLSLGEIAVGNENAINALVDIIRNSNHDDTKSSAAYSLREILKNKHMPKVVAILTSYLSVETYNYNPSQFENCYGIIWKCAQNMTYPEFYQAWHQQNNSTI